MKNNINKAAILHIPVSQYAFATATDIITIRLRTAKADIDTVTLFWGDRCCETNPITMNQTKMEVRWQDELYDYYEIRLEKVPERFCYYFKLEKENEWIYYYADKFSKELADITLMDGFFIEGRSGYYQYPMILKEEVQHIPEWFQNAVVYNIFPDSFATGKKELKANRQEVVDELGCVHRSELGGTIKGITENLEYIAGLGFNCIYLNPIFAAGEYHKYDIIDYFHIDPVLGTDEDFRKLTDRAHALGMRVLIDGVFNHCGWKNKLFMDVVEKGDSSQYKNWFYHMPLPVKIPTDHETPSYTCFAYEKKMPKLNTSNPEVQKYFAKVGRYWIEEFHIDGWRLDVANEIDKNFWRCFKQSVIAAKKDAVMIGEVWENAIDWLKPDMMDSAMNYDFRNNCIDLFALRRIGVEEFWNHMTDMWLRYSEQISRAQLNLLDSHDVPRFLSICNNDIRLWKIAFVFQSFFPGVPGTFYGDEKGISGLREREYRKAMPWEEDATQLEDMVRNIYQIRRDWITPDAEWKAVYDETVPEILILDRSATGRIRVIINTSEKCIDIRKQVEQGFVLYSEGLKDYYIDTYGFCIVKM